jgi:hypothetical protein
MFEFRINCLCMCSYCSNLHVGVYGLVNWPGYQGFSLAGCLSTAPVAKDLAWLAAFNQPGSQGFSLTGCLSTAPVDKDLAWLAACQPARLTRI